MVIYPFLANKYTATYFRICVRAAIREAQTIHSETHHVLPRSLGGNDDSENLVRLTPREHFVCHRLLVRMTESFDRRRMLFALWRMCNGKTTGRYVSSRTYEFARRAVREQYRDPVMDAERRAKMRDALLGRPLTQETRRKLSESLTRFYAEGGAHPWAGRKHSEETRARLRKPKKTTGQQYRIYLPNGSTEIVDNLSQFCRLHDLRIGTMHEVINGGQRQHQGYRAERLGPKINKLRKQAA